MIVLVDTTIWSLAFRRRQPSEQEHVLIGELSELVRELRAVLIGPIRQEILSGIPDQTNFEKVKQHLSAFDDLAIESCDYEEAAQAFNACRKRGIQGSHIDYLICAVAKRYAAPVFTTDKDFVEYARHLSLALYEPRKKNR